MGTKKREVQELFSEVVEHTNGKMFSEKEILDEIQKYRIEKRTLA